MLRAELQEITDLATAVKRGELIPFKTIPPLTELIGEITQRKITVLTPLRKGEYGVDHLNQLLFVEHQKRKSREIPVIIRVNAPSLDLYNGDLGVWDLETGIVTFSPPSGEKRSFAETLLPYYEYAYVLSVHKSQGSEYERVLILLPPGSEAFSREMLYTAITRAKKGVEIYADPTTLNFLLANRSHRHSGLNLKHTLL